MRIAVCDEDEKGLSYLKELVTEYQLSRGGKIKCLFFDNTTDFLCDMKGGEYDLVLLDILLPEGSGIHTAHELRKLDKNVKLILVSSSPEFALESYDVGAYHYLLKPVDAGVLFPLFDRVGNELAAEEKEGFVIKSREGIVRITFAQIEYVEVINKTVFLHLTDGVVHELTAALREFEKKLLSRPEFAKTHRSYLVNLRYIRSIDAKCIVTENGHSIPVSRQRRNRVQDACMCFLHLEEPAHEVSGVQDAAVRKQECPDGPWRILLVDDDAADRAFWADILQAHGCLVQMAVNGEEALHKALDGPYDCVLLDVMIPGEDGFSICEKLRTLVHAPIIFLSCVTETDRQVEGFATGGTDYITKDTPAALFWAKVETRIRLAMSGSTRLGYGPLSLELAEHRALIDGKDLLLAPIEFDILWCLAEHAGHVFTPEEISGMVLGGQPWDGGQAVQIHMSRLRRKLEKAWGEHSFIETVWGRGYRFAPADN